MSEHPADAPTARVTITEHAYAQLAGVAADDGPTIRAGLARSLGPLASEHDLDGLEADWRAAAADALPDGLQLEGESITAPAGTEPHTGLADGAPLAGLSTPHTWHAVFDLESRRVQISTAWRAHAGWPPAAELPIPPGDAAAALEALDEALARPVLGPSGYRSHWERTTPWGGAGERGIASLRRIAD